MTPAFLRTCGILRSSRKFNSPFTIPEQHRDTREFWPTAEAGFPMASLPHEKKIFETGLKTDDSAVLDRQGISTQGDAVSSGITAQLIRRAPISSREVAFPRDA